MTDIGFTDLTADRSASIRYRVEMEECSGKHPDRTMRSRQITGKEAERVWQRVCAEPRTIGRLRQFTNAFSNAIEDTIERIASIHIGFREITGTNFRLSGFFTDDEWVLIRLKFL